MTLVSQTWIEVINNMLNSSPGYELGWYEIKSTEKPFRLYSIRSREVTWTKFIPQWPFNMAVYLLSNIATCKIRYGLLSNSLFYNEFSTNFQRIMVIPKFFSWLLEIRYKRVLLLLWCCPLSSSHHIVKYTVTDLFSLLRYQLLPKIQYFLPAFPCWYTVLILQLLKIGVRV